MGIEDFNLYGEFGSLPDVVHCETIETRSLLHDWEFKPHRHAGLHQFIFVDDGGGHAQVEESQFSLRPDTLVNLPAGAVHGFRFEPGTKGWVVTLAAELLDAELVDVAKQSNTPHFADRRRSCWRSGAAATPRRDCCCRWEWCSRRCLAQVALDAERMAGGGWACFESECVHWRGF